MHLIKLTVTAEEDGGRERGIFALYLQLIHLGGDGSESTHTTLSPPSPSTHTLTHTHTHIVGLRVESLVKRGDDR